MKITTNELKSIIKEALKEELSRKPIRRGFIKRGLKEDTVRRNDSQLPTLNSFYKKYGDVYDIQLDENSDINIWINDWLNVGELKRISSQSAYDRLKSGKEVLVLHGNDIGDGHGDLMAYIYSDGKDLFFQLKCSNSIFEQPIESYNDFKNHIYFEDLWQDVYFESMNKYRYDDPDEYEAFEHYYDLTPHQFAPNYIFDDVYPDGYYGFEDIYNSNDVKKYLF